MTSRSAVIRAVFIISLTISLFFVAVSGARAGLPCQTLWTEQMGTGLEDVAYGVSVDSSGAAYVCGWTYGDLDGNASAGGQDMFLIKYNSAGIKQWTRQLGTSSDDYATDVSVDSTGNVYVCGVTSGGIDGNSSAGNRDTFLVKYNSSGVKQWTRQLGNSYYDDAYGVSLDAAGNAYVCGLTYYSLDGNTDLGGDDVFLVKYDPSGVKQWTRQTGSDSTDYAFGLAVDPAGDAYICGTTSGALAGETSAGSGDIILIKYNSSGDIQWNRQMGTSGAEHAYDVAVGPSGDVYVCGFTSGGLDGNTNAGSADLFLAKYDSSGARQWTRQMGTVSDDSAYGVSVDSSGAAYVCGVTNGGLDGNTSVGGVDFFLVKYDPSGARQWTKQMGTGSPDNAADVSVDSSGAVYVAGFTEGGLDGNANAGGKDLFVMKLGPDPASSITSPAGGATLAGTSATISGEATATNGVAFVEVSTDDATWRTASGTTTWSYSWTLPANGSYTIKSRATDSLSNVETPNAGVAVTVGNAPDNTPPVSTISRPGNGALIGGTASYNVTGGASDGTGAGVKVVEVSINGGAWQAAAGTNPWSYNWSLPEGGSCTVRSRATDKAGNVETPGAGVTVTVDDTPPQPVTSLTATDAPNDNGGVIRLYWDGYSPPTDTSFYRVYRGAAPFGDISGMTPVGTVNNPDTRTYDDSTVTNGVYYYYAVTAVDALGNENKSVFAAKGMALDTGIPPPVTTFTAIDTDGDYGDSVTLDWTGYGEPPDVTAYKVYRKTSAITTLNGLTPILTFGPGNFTAYDTSVARNIHYYYAITATDASGHASPFISVGPVTPRDNVPPAVSISAVVPASVKETQTSKVSWITHEGGTFVVYVNGQAVLSGAATKDTSADSIIDGGLSCLVDGANEITVTVMDIDGNIGTSKAAYLNLDTRPSAPMGLSATASAGGSVRLSWYANTEPDIAGYRVYRTADLNTPPTQIGAVSPGSTTYYIDSSPVGTTGYYCVAAIDKGGAVGDQSGMVSYTSGLTLPVVKVESVVPSAANKWDTVYLGWKSDKDVDYEVYLGGDGTRGGGRMIDSGKAIANTQAVSSFPLKDNLDALVAGQDDVYIFATSDGGVHWAGGSASFCFVAGLGAASVTPSSGGASGTYTFSVEYYDPAGRPLGGSILTYGLSGGGSYGSIAYPETLGAGVNGVYTCAVTGIGVGVNGYTFSFFSPSGPSVTSGSGPVVTKDPSSITAAVTPTDLVYGKNVTVTGAVTPAPSLDKPVNVTFTGADGLPHVVTAERRVGGNYTCLFGPDNAGAWTATASWDGDDVCGKASSAPQAFTVAKASTSVTCSASMSPVVFGNSVDITGALSTSPNVGADLTGLVVTVYFRDPDGASTSQTTVTDKDGLYRLNDFNRFGKVGPWQVVAQFAGDAHYSLSSSQPVAVDVARSAGYAILVQGRRQDGEGMDQHGETLRNVYAKLTGKRGISAANIRYFNYDTTQPGATDATTKAAVQQAITVWAPGRMNSQPGPLYIIFVGHGDPGLFRMYQTGDASDLGNNVTPDEVSSWLDTLQAGLDKANKASESDVFFIYGACYSGSFIPKASGPAHRIIITSTKDDEESQRAPGPSTPGHPRDGEYFINRFFNNVAMGDTVYDSFTLAAASVGNSSFSGVSQHALLDDNRDKAGSNDLGPSPQDGGVVKDKSIGFTPNAGASTFIFAVTPGMTLTSDQTKPDMLWARVSDTSRVNPDGVWLEVIPPGYVPDTSNGQVVVDLPTSVYEGYAGGEFQWTNLLDSKGAPLDFSKPGEYQVRYYAKDNVTGDVSDYMMTRIYKPKAGNTPPSAFNLLQPANGSQPGTTLVFAWEGSTDPDGLTYKIEVSTTADMVSGLAMSVEGLANAFYPVGSTSGLHDSTDYYWRVTATDSYGLSATSGVFKFHTNNTNGGIDAILCGSVYDSATKTPIVGASVSVDGQGAFASRSDGIYFMGVTTGQHTATFSADHYNSLTKNFYATSGGSLKVDAPMVYIQDATAPASTLTAPTGGKYLAGPSSTITGTSSDGPGSGVRGVEVGVTSGSGTAWASLPASATSDGWAHWSHTWTLPADGGYTIMARATDNAGNVETPGAGVAVVVDNTPPTSSITNPKAGSPISGDYIVITGTATDGKGSGVSKVEVSIDGGWSTATDTSGGGTWATWSYRWGPLSLGAHLIKSRATDKLLLNETPGAGVSVSVLPEKLLTTTVSPAAGGSLAISPASADGYYMQGTTVRLTAAPAAGYVFTQWGGGASGATSPVNVVMDSDRSVTANFKQKRTLTLAATTGGSVSASPAPTGGYYIDGAVVTITATESAGYMFTGWSGAATVTTNPLSVTMDSDKSITANFKLKRALTLAATTGGTVSASPNATGGYYTDGAVVTITAKATVAGYVFVGWTGDATGTASPLTVTMDNDKNITANFAKLPYLRDVSPGKTGAGAVVTLNGVGFGSSGGGIMVGATRARAASWTDTKITLIVSTRMAKGTYNVVVTPRGGTPSNARQLQVMGPSITGVNPKSGHVGASVTLTGQYFGARPAVTMTPHAGGRAYRCRATSSTGSSITFAIPRAGAGAYDIRVTNTQGTSNAVPFTVN